MVEKQDDKGAAGSPSDPTTADPVRSSLATRPSLRGPALPRSGPPQKPLKRRRRPTVALASGLLSFLGIAAIALAIVWAVGNQRIDAAGPLTADKVLVVRPGNDLSVVDQLLEDGVIDNRVLMTAALWLEGGRGNIKSGEYLFKQQASLRDVIDTLVAGKQILHAVTIPEGLTSEQVVDRLRENDVLIGDILAVPAEGSLMPDTYKFARGTTREQVVRSMQNEQKRITAEVWARRSLDTPIRSPFELVTLASIVEKETGKADERPHVASVFVNRLARNMPLQSDPTIVYGLVGGKGTLGRGILKSEIEQKTPYNTYTTTGLPPGPIANPGKAALDAVANPAHTRDLYFVADGTGGHAFADSLDQHRLNVVRWRQIEKDKSGPPESDKPAPVGASAPALPRADQRGDIDVNSGKFDDVLTADGAAGLPDGTAGGAAPPVAPALAAGPAPRPLLPTFAQSTMPMAVPGVESAAGVPAPGRAAGAPAASVATSTAKADSPTFDELDIEVGGVKSRSDPASWGDGDGMASGVASGEPSGNGTMQTFPVPPQHLAEQRARAIALGLLPPDGGATQYPENAPVASADGAAPTGIHLYGKGKIIDASEGTSFDPLRDKTYDLTTAKIVPTLKALPPVSPLASSSK